MICKICGKDTIEYRQIKNGNICTGCYNELPRSFKENIQKINTKQLASAKKILHKATSKSWAVCNNIATVSICDHSIQIDKIEIMLKDIKSIKLNYHPKSNGSRQGYAYGMITIIIETAEPHIMIEEPFMMADVAYYINGKTIAYSYPTKIQQMFTNIQEVINNKTYDTSSFKPHKESAHTKSTNKGAAQRPRPTTEFERAKMLYEVEIPFTVEQINKKKKELMKKNHPDIGGDPAKAVEINAAYDLLVKFAD